MSNKYDIEMFIDEMIALVKADLPAKISEINIEKNDDITLPTVGNSDYYDDISEQVFYKNQFIYYSLVDVATESAGHNVSLDVTLAISVLFSNINSSGTIKKVMRYTRCLREIFQESFKKTGKASQIKVTEFIPVDIQTNQGSDFKMGGIQIQASIVG